MKYTFTLILFIFQLNAIAQFSVNNKVVHFSNATDEGISIPNSNLMPIGVSQSFTVEYWIKTTDAVNSMMVYVQQYCPGPSTGTLTGISQGKVFLGLDAINATYTTVVSECSIPDGAWHHIACVRNAITDSLYIYIDGVENGRIQDVTSGTLTNVANFTAWVGRRTWCGSISNFYGDLDEVRVWTKAKTQAEIIAQKDMELVGNELELKLYYNFNTATNGNAQTVLNNCTNTGTALNGTTQGTVGEPSYNFAQPVGFFTPCFPLPLHLISFVGKLQNSNAALKWVTADMVNIKGFEIEKSADSKTFLKIGFEAATTATDYSFVDNLFFGRTNYYRLKMIDVNGQYFYSNTVLLTHTNTIGINIYPNPNNGNFTIHISDNLQNAQVKIYSILGELVYNTKITGEFTTLNANLKAGLYFVSVENGNQKSMQKIIVE
jgi:Concanavalin A-like lectin/glucanases superfamily/Secretion system C-terminal sorting domain